MTDWIDSLPEDIRGHEAFKSVKAETKDEAFASIAKQFVDQQTYLGNAIRVPGPDAGDEDRKKFYDKLMAKVPGLVPTPNPEDPDSIETAFRQLGKPESHDKYTKIEGMPESEQIAFAELAHQANLTDAQYQSLMKAIQGRQSKSEESAQAAFNEGMRELQREWGFGFKDHMEMVKNFMKGTKAPEQIMELAADNKLDPAVTKWFHEIATRIGVENMNFDSNPLEQSHLTPAEARSRISELLSNKEGPYWNAADPGHKEAVQRMVDYQKALVG